MPQSNQSDDPAMSVTTLAIQPPVQLSAVTSMWWPSRSCSPTRAASWLRWSSENEWLDMGQGRRTGQFFVPESGPDRRPRCGERRACNAVRDPTEAARDARTAASADQATLPAAWPEAQAHWKL